MYTKEKIKFPLLKDKVAKKLFTEKKVGLEYLRKIISLATGIGKCEYAAAREESHKRAGEYTSRQAPL